jgi:abortive infection bacteriophage resistance protein
MGQIATSLKKQIEILQLRGMNLDFEEEKVKELLLDIGYYRLGFYWFPFSNPTTHDFEHDVNLSDVLSLYYFDTDLKNLLTKYLTRFEINFRTKLIYEVSNAYPDSPTWFIDQSIVNKPFIDSFDKYYYNDKFKRNNIAIKKHHAKYINHKYAPAWKTIEFLTFGSVLELYRALKNDLLKEKIALHYEIKNPTVFEGHIRIILNIRNICAHNGILFDYNSPKGIKSIPDLDINHKNRNSLAGVMKLISFYISKISINRQIDFDQALKDLKTELNPNLLVKSVVAENIGL